MSERVIVRFPCSFQSPPLKSNDRGNWQVRHHRTAPVRSEGRVRGWQAIQEAADSHIDYPINGPVDVRLLWMVPDRRRRDADGPQPTLKAFVDGLVDAGVFSDDRHTVVRRTWCEIVYRPSQPEMVQVEVIAVPDNSAGQMTHNQPNSDIQEDET